MTRFKRRVFHFLCMEKQYESTFETNSSIGYGCNPEFIEALKRSHCILVAGKHIQLALGADARVDPFMEEHLEIVTALRAHNPLAVCETLTRHLKLSAEKAIHRLTAFRGSQSVAELPYILEP